MGRLRRRFRQPRSSCCWPRFRRMRPPWRVLACLDLTLTLHPHLSPLTSHLSPLTSHLSPLTLTPTPTQASAALDAAVEMEGHALAIADASEHLFLPPQQAAAMMQRLLPEARAHAHTCIICIHAHTCTHAHTCAHAHPHTCTHAHPHTCTSTHMHTCT